MSIIQEFKAFAVKGNVVDMAVGIVIGASFGKIVTSFVSDMIMPPIGFFVGGVDFSQLVISLKVSESMANPVVISYGKFIQTLVDFTIVAFALFLLIKAVNRLRKTPTAQPEAGPSREEILLGEIRDLLKSNR